MSAPINTRHRTSNFSKPSATVAPLFPPLFPIQTERRPPADAENMRRPAADAPFVQEKAVETGGPPPRTDPKKCEDWCRVLVGALIYIYIYIYVFLLFWLISVDQAAQLEIRCRRQLRNPRTWACPGLLELVVGLLAAAEPSKPRWTDGGGDAWRRRKRKVGSGKVQAKVGVA